jgi:stress-induced morphogen
MIKSIIGRYTKSFIFALFTTMMILFILWPFGALTFILFYSIFGFILSIPIAIIFAQAWTFALYPGIKIGIMAPVVVLQILAYFFIRTPLKLVGSSASRIWNGFEAAIENMESEEKKRPKIRYILLYLFFFVALLIVFGVNLNSIGSLLTQAIFITVPIVFLPLILTFFVSALAVRGGSKGEKDGKNQLYERRERSSTVDKYKEKGRQMKEGAKKGKKAYNDLKEVGEKADKVKDIANKGGKAENKGLMRIAKSLEKVPGLKRLAPSIAEASGGTVILVLILGLIAILITWFIVMIAFWALSYFFLAGILFPFLAELLAPLGGAAAGFAGAIEGYAIIGASVAPDTPDVQTTGFNNAIRQAQARLGCMMQPGCYQERLRNQSQRPGAEAKGQEFGLKIERFSVNRGAPLDIQGLYKDDTLDMRLDVENPIRGLKGIDAHGAWYRVNIKSEADQAKCESDWVPLDAAGRTSVLDGGGKIPKGTTAQAIEPPDNITLKNCGMLQPTGPGRFGGVNFEPEADVIYNYSSQSTLNVDIMSEKYRGDEDIKQGMKKSVTARTPVQAYLNVYSPLTFNIRNGDRTPRVYSLQIGFDPTDYEISRFKVIPEDIKIYGSELLVPVGESNMINSGSCDDLKRASSGENVFVLSEEGIRTNFGTQKGGDWYRITAEPGLSCDMTINPDMLDQISRTGESAQLSIDANYTVMNTEEDMRLSGGDSEDSFKVVNRLCGPSTPCPLLVTEKETENSPYLRNDCVANWRANAQIDGPGNKGGCTVVKNKYKWGLPEEYNRDFSEFSSVITEGESAFTIKTVKNQIDNNPPKTSGGNILTIENSVNEKAAIGLKQSPKEKAKEEGILESISSSSDHKGWILYAQRGDTQKMKLEMISQSFCGKKEVEGKDKKKDISKQKMKKKIASEFSVKLENIYYAKFIEKNDC